MSFFSSSFLSSSKEHDIILSVGSGSVCGAVVDLQKNSKPKIVHTHKSPFPVRKEINGEELGANMLGALHKVVSSLVKEHKKKVKTVHIVFASPWFSPFSKTLNIKKAEEFTVSEKIIEKLVNEQASEIVKSTPEKDSDKDSALVEKVISHIKLNGYETLDPYGKSTKNLDVSVYASMVPKPIIDKIESEVYKTVHPTSIVSHTFPFVAWNAVASIFSPKEDFFFIDIGSEVSDILIIRNSAIYSLVSFPMGTNHIVRKVALHFETTPELAESIINLFTSDSAEATLKAKAGTIVSAFGEEWRMQFGRSVGEAQSKTNDHFIPQRAFLISDQNYAGVLGNMLGQQVSNTTVLTRDNLSQFVEFGANEMPNIFIAIEAIYLNSHFANKQSVYNHKQPLVK